MRSRSRAHSSTCTSRAPSCAGADPYIPTGPIERSDRRSIWSRSRIPSRMRCPSTRAPLPVLVWFSGAAVLCPQRLGPLLDAEEKAAGHDEGRRLHDAHAQPPQQGVRHLLAAARDESRALIVERIQTELPYPLEAAILV